MKALEVNKDLCISCGACVGIAPEIFQFGSDDKAEVKTDSIPNECKDDVIDAVDGCPTNAIKYEEIA